MSMVQEQTSVANVARSLAKFASSRFAPGGYDSVKLPVLAKFVAGTTNFPLALLSSVEISWIVVAVVGSAFA